MNDYEVLLMLDAELPEERGGEIVARAKEQVEGDKGTWDGHEPWGRRKLAYEIDHKGEGQGRLDEGARARGSRVRAGADRGHPARPGGARGSRARS